MKTPLRLIALSALALAAAQARAAEAPAVDPEAVRAESARNWDEAVRIHTARLEAEPGRADLWLRIADIESQRGRTQEVVKATARAAALRPGDAPLQARLSQACAVANQPREALAAIAKAVELDPSNPDYLRSATRIANWLGESAIAAGYCERLLALAPDDTEARLTLARALSWQGELDESASAYRKYLRARPSDTAAMLEFARVQSWRGNFAAALDILDECARRGVPAETMDAERARVLVSADRPRESMAILDKLLARQPESFELHYSAALARHYGRQPDATRQELDALRKLRPESRDVAQVEPFLLAPLRSHAELALRYYKDSDDLAIGQLGLDAELALSDTLRLTAACRDLRLRAPPGSGLEHADGTPEANAGELLAGLDAILDPALRATARIGAVRAEQHEMFAWEANLNYRPADSLSIDLSGEHDYVLISARSASLGIRQTAGAVSVTAKPDLLYTIPLTGRYAEFSDGNTFWSYSVSPRRSVLRSEWINLDLGASASGFGYAEDLSNGYYDPQTFERYAIIGLGYLKTGRESGASISGSAGYFRDNTMDAFDFGWSVDAAFTAGAFSDWTLKVAGSVFENLRESGLTPFRAWAASASLVRRF